VRKWLLLYGFKAKFMGGESEMKGAEGRERRSRMMGKEGAAMVAKVCMAGGVWLSK